MFFLKQTIYDALIVFSRTHNICRSDVGPYHNSKITQTDVSASGGTDIQEKPSHVPLHNSQASYFNTPKGCLFEDANNTQPANDPSFEPLIDSKSRRASNEAVQIPDNRRKVDLPCLNLSIATLGKQCSSPLICRQPFESFGFGHDPLLTKAFTPKGRQKV